MARERLVWMDSARGLAVLLVILLHATELPIPDAPAWLDAVNAIFAPFRMPMLLFLSGMLLGNSMEKAPWPFIEGKAAAILWPFVLWTSVDLGRRGYWQDPVEAIGKIFTSPHHMWYLEFLFLYYLAALLLHRLRIPFAPVAVGSLILSGVIGDAWRFEEMAYLFPFFLFGHLAASGRPIALADSAVVALGMLVVTSSVISASGTEVRYDPLLIWGPASLILVLLARGSALLSGAWTSGLQWVGRNSIAFYVAHMPMLYVTRGLLKAVGITTHLPVMVGAMTVALLWCTALSLGRTRSRLIAALFDLRALKPRGKDRRAAA